jgi:RNA polymerase sigma-70 factor (ECF subfamily)
MRSDFMSAEFEPLTEVGDENIRPSLAMKKPSLSKTDSSAEFTRLYDGCSVWLFGYLFSLLGNHNDAEEVLAETAKVLWEKFDQYSRHTEFRAWACRIAQFNALSYRAKARRRGGVFSDSLFALMDEEAVVMADRLDERIAALDDCLEKLPARERKLIQRRYSDEGSVAAIAKALRVSIRRVYQMIERIHTALFECVNRALAE